jgi:hemerythrin-like metal-binding protein
MQKIDWQDFLSMDVGTWDAGRRLLLSTVNRLADPVTARDVTIVSEVIDRLAADAAAQFAMEDAEMVDNGYPLALLHRHRHENLLGQIAGWRRRVAEEWRIGTGTNLFLTLSLALFRHFSDDDLVTPVICKIKPSLQRRGSAGARRKDYFSTRTSLNDAPPLPSKCAVTETEPGAARNCFSSSSACSCPA